jgi:hypothetical protein
MPYQSQAAAVLVRWRIVERDLTMAVPGSPETDALQAEAMRLRDEYQALIEAAQRNDRPEPPAFPEGSVT